MASTWTCFGFALLLCLCACAWAAPSVNDIRQFGELERTLKELATSLLTMSGAVAAGGAEDDRAGDLEAELMGSDAASALLDLSRFHL